MAAAQYIVSLAEYGFNLTGTRKLAVSRQEGDEKVAEVFWGVMWTKLTLALTGAVLLLACVFIFPKLHEYSAAIYPFFFWALGVSMFPQWYFQGIEKMGVITVINMTAKISVLPLTLLFIHTPQDGVRYAILFSSIYFAASAVGVLAAIREVGIFKRPRVETILRELKEGFSMFFAMVGYTIYSNTNALVIGLVGGDVMVGLFIGAEKFLRAALGILGPLHAAIYPRVSATAASAKNSTVEALRTLLKWEGLASFAVSVAMALSAEYIVLIFLGKKFTGSIEILRAMSPVFFFTAVSSIFGTLTLLPFGEQRAYTRVLLAAAVIHVVSLALLVPKWGALGAGISMSVSEGAIMVIMFLIILKKRLLART